MAGTWTRKADILIVARPGDADPPDLNLLEQEAAHLAAVLGAELDLNVTSD